MLSEFNKKGKELEHLLLTMDLVELTNYYKKKRRDMSICGYTGFDLESLDIKVHYYISVISVLDNLLYRSDKHIDYKRGELLADMRVLLVSHRNAISSEIRRRKLSGNSFNSKILNFGAFTDCHDSFKKTSSGHFKGIKGISL